MGLTMSNRLCVITPSFNQGRFIERTLQSVLDQGIADLDYVVVDGASTDETVEVLQRYGDHVRWVSEPDRGQAHAVNKGLTQTEADIVCWLNSDDVYLPGALSAVQHYFDTHPDVDVLYGGAHHIDEEGGFIEDYPTEPFDAQRLTETCFLCQPATFFRRRLVAQMGPLDERLQFCMDYEYWLRANRVGARFAFLDQPLAGSRLYATNKTLGQRVAVHAEMNRMFRRTLDRVPDRWLSNHAHAVLEARGLTHARRPLTFAIAVSLLCWANALRWNRSISRAMWHETQGWIRGNWAAFRAKRRSPSP